MDLQLFMWIIFRNLLVTKQLSYNENYPTNSTDNKWQFI